MKWFHVKSANRPLHFLSDLIDDRQKNLPTTEFKLLVRYEYDMSFLLCELLPRFTPETVLSQSFGLEWRLASPRMCHKNTPRRILPSGVCISPRHIAASVFASCQVTRSLFIRWTCRSILSRSRRCSACARRCPRPLRL